MGSPFFRYIVFPVITVSTLHQPRLTSDELRNINFYFYPSPIYPFILHPASIMCIPPSARISCVNERVIKFVRSSCVHAWRRMSSIIAKFHLFSFSSTSTTTSLRTLGCVACNDSCCCTYTFGTIACVRLGVRTIPRTAINPPLFRSCDCACFKSSQVPTSTLKLFVLYIVPPSTYCTVTDLSTIEQFL